MTAEKLSAAAEMAKHDYDRLNITAEVELAVMMYLENLGILQMCGTRTGCNGPCPQGQGCIETNRGNCVCSR